jgi:lipooligosaccharide transport system permease protein
VTGSAPLLLVRMLPGGSYAGRSWTLLLRSAKAARRTWLALVPGIFEPVFYLAALGHGLGSVIAAVPGPDGSPISYAAFIAPGLLAASTMNGAVFDSTFTVFYKLTRARLYDAMLATPMGTIDIALGEICWSLIRGGLYALGFLLVMAVSGVLASPWALLALPAALLVASAFAAVGMACTTFMRSWQDFDLVGLAVLPMFLFSATFFPLSVYPPALRLVVECLPLYHAVELMRGLTAGTPDAAMLGHVGYFLVMIAVGLVVTARRLDVLLLR